MIHNDEIRGLAIDIAAALETEDYERIEAVLRKRDEASLVEALEWAKSGQLAHELEQAERWPANTRRTIDAYCEDTEFHCDVRELIIWGFDEGFEIEAYLRGETHSARYGDLLRVYGMLQQLGRDDLTAACIDFSLCPVHRCDWAICFDDATDECEQIRQIYPRSHDT